MKIQPINTTNNVYHKRPLFGMARISPTILEQIQSKEKLAKNIDVVAATKGVIYSIPTAIAANLVVNNKFDDSKSIEENATKIRPLDENAIRKLTTEELTTFLKGQDKEGKTVLHKEYDWNFPGYIETKLEPKTLASVFSIKDKDNKTAYMANPNKVLENSIYRVATQSALPLKDSINLLKTNEMNPKVIEFLEYRIDKNDGTVNSIIAPHILSQLRAEKDTISVIGRTNYINGGENYKNLKQETVAKLFISNSANKYPELDRKYLAKADDSSLVDLVQKSLDDIGATNTLSELMVRNTELIQRIKYLAPEFNFLGVARSHIDKIDYNIFTKADNLRAYIQTDERGNNPLHCAADKESDFADHLRFIKKNFNEKDVVRILSMENCDGKIPMSLSAFALNHICMTFYNKSEILIKMLKNKDNEGNTPLHDFANVRTLDTVFGAFANKEEELADILSTQNKKGQTIYTHIKEIDNLRNDETINMIKNKIITLATKSDLSLEKSYTLLKNNNLEPAIQEFLKLQIEQSGKEVKG